jgi:hypothetical protein
MTTILERDPIQEPKVKTFPVGMLFAAQPVPIRDIPPREFVMWDGRQMGYEELLPIAEWNMFWESAHLRAEHFRHNLYRDDPTRKNHQPESLPAWVERFADRNMTILPLSKTMFEAYEPLYHLMPYAHLERFGLPIPKGPGMWPPLFLREKAISRSTGARYFGSAFHKRFAEAFSAYIWPFLTAEKRGSFTASEPLRLLASNLEFWIAPLYDVAEHIMKQSPFTEIEYPEDEARMNEINRLSEPEGYVYKPMRYAIDLWSGEEEARETTEMMVERADQTSNIRAIVDAIRRNRAEEDFSPYWTHEREAFERAVYHKRAKTKVLFIEIPDSAKIHSPSHEIEGSDSIAGVEREIDFSLFEASLDPKARQVFVLLRNGKGPTDIARSLGYANHSPVSKQLAKLRRLARNFLA